MVGMATAIDRRLGQYSMPPNSQPPTSQHGLPQLPQLSHPSQSSPLPSHPHPAQHQQLPPIHHTLNRPRSYHDSPLAANHGIASPSSARGFYSHGPVTSHPQSHAPQPYAQHGQGEDTDYDGDDGSVGDVGSPHDSPAEGASPTGADSGKGPDAKRPRACDSCRGLKVKCIIDQNSGEPCKRCAKAGRNCIVTPPTRKRQKKADNRVAELERKIDALTASLAQRDGKVPDDFNFGIKRGPDPLDSSPAQAKAGDAASSPYKRLRRESCKQEIVMAGSANDPSSAGCQTGQSIYNQMGPAVYDHSDIDLKLDSIIPSHEAERLFDRYVHEFVPHFPAVPFAPGTTAQQIRKEKPILFLAILSGTSYGANIHPDIQIALERELRGVFAECTWKNGEKSLQLIQALQVGALWYRPPANFAQHMFYQMVHMATIMAIDIGIGKRQSLWRKKFFSSASKLKPMLADPESVEARRAWLVNYFLCITIAMILRRPILLRFNDFVRECLEVLETSPDALPSDKILCQHVRLAKISEEIAIQFAMDDPSVNLTINDGKVTYGIKHHEKDLADLRARNEQTPSIQLNSHVTNLYLHEIALHSQNNVDDFKAPFTEETFRAAVNQVVLGPSHVDALIECQNSCRKVIETFLAIDLEVMFHLPVIFSVRITYAVVVLIKLYLSATTPGEISNVIKEQDLHIEENLSRLEQSFKSITERDKLAPHTKFLFVIQQLVERYRGIKRQQDKTKKSDKPEKVEEAAQKPTSRPSSATEGRSDNRALHLLSEVAMSTSPGAAPTHSPSPLAFQHGSSSAPAVTPVMNATQLTPRSATYHPQQPTHKSRHSQHLIQSMQSPHTPPQPQQQPTPPPTHSMPQAAQQQQQPQPPQQQQQQQQSWFPDMQQMPMGDMYDYPGNFSAALEGFDYGLSGMGMGLEGAVGGLFMGDTSALWMGNSAGWPGAGWS